MGHRLIATMLCGALLALQPTSAQTPAEAERRQAADAADAALEARLAVAEADVLRARENYRRAYQLHAAHAPAAAEAILAEMQPLADLFPAADRAQQLKQRLAAQPNDTAARAELVRLLVGQLAAFAEAAQWADETIDADLRRRVSWLQREPDSSDPVDAAALARWLKDLAASAPLASRCQLLARSLAYYRRALVAGGGETAPIAAELEDAAQQLLDLVPPGPVRLPADAWFDLCPSVRELRVDASWRYQDGRIIHEGQGRTAFGIPLRPDGPYDLELHVIQHAADATFLLEVPYGDLQAAIALNDPVGTDRLNVRDVRPSAIRPGRLRKLRLRVQPEGPDAGITVYLDGKPYLTCPEVERRSSGQKGALPASSDQLVLAASGHVEITWLAARAHTGRAVLKAANPYWQVLRERSVMASRPWQWLAHLRVGNVLRLDSSGEWGWSRRDVCGPKGDQDGWHGLLGRQMPEGSRFSIGTGRWVIAIRDGPLHAQIEDADLTDNRGWIDVTVTALMTAGSDDRTVGLEPPSGRLLINRDAVAPRADAAALLGPAARGAPAPMQDDPTALVHRLITERDFVGAAALLRAAAPAEASAPADEREALGALAEEATQRAAWQQQRDELLQQLARDPDDLSTRKRVITISVAELDDSAAAMDLDHPGLDSAWRSALALTARPVTHLSAEACLELAAWYESFLPQASPSGRSALTARALACYTVATESVAADSEIAAQARASRERLIEAARSGDLPGHGAWVRGAWIDLLALPHADLTPQHSWRREDGSVALVMGPMPIPQVDLPMHPFGAYTLEMVFERLAGKRQLRVLLPDAAGRMQFLSLAPIDDSPDDLGEHIHARIVALPEAERDPFRVQADRCEWSVELSGAHQADDDAMLGLRRYPGIWIQGMTTTAVIREARLRMHEGIALPIMAERLQRHKRIHVQAARSWIPIFPVRTGDVVRIVADGPWTPWLGRGQAAVTGPEGLPARGEREAIGYLEAHIGEGEPIVVGQATTLHSDSDGTLMVRMHDDDRSDNAGSVQVDVQIIERQP